MANRIKAAGGRAVSPCAGNPLRRGYFLFALLAALCLALAIAFQVNEARAQAEEPTPPELVFSEITTNSFLATLTAVAGCDTEDVVVTYRPTGDAQAAWIAVASGTCSDLDGEYSIVGLEPLTQYEVRVQTTLDGSDEALETDSLVTTAPVAQPVVYSVTVSGITGTTATVTISFGTLQNSARLFYRYRPTAGGSWSGSYLTTPPNSPRSVTLSGLTTGTAYTVASIHISTTTSYPNYVPNGTGWAQYPNLM